MNNIRIIMASLVLAITFGLAACKPSSEPTAGQPAESSLPPAPEASAAEPVLVSGIDTSGFDISVRPQDDLYRHVNGHWIDTTELPADRSRWGSFDIIIDKSENDVRALIEEVSRDADAADGSATQKIRDYYNSYMDTGAATALGVDALRDELDRIEAIEDRTQLLRLFGELGAYGVQPPVGFGVFSDFKDPDTAVVYVVEAGLTLPDRDYYLLDDEQFVKGRELYRQYAARVLELAGRDNPAERAQALYELEHRMAEAHYTKEDNRNPVLLYNPHTHDELRELAPAIDWDALFEAGQLPARDRYVVRQVEYIRAASDILAETPLATWKDYATLQTLHAFAQVLGDNLFQAWFEFERAGLSGIAEPRPRWKLAVNATGDQLGELLGQLYVERHYRQESRARMEQMIANLVEAYRQSINELEWMSDETRQQALDKLSKFNPKIGYPENWRDYSKVDIAAGDLVGNVKRASRFEYLRNIDKLDKPIDKSEWFMTPQTVNAYYNPAWNEIVFPAAILQPPFFNVEADDAVNYASIGAAIGHEIGHGFDDQGRQFDGNGSLRDWWTEEDAGRFDQLKDKLAAQYDGYEVIDGLTINGQFTSGENIGDLGGLGIAYKAYRLSLNGQEAPVIDGMTGDQRFFYGWAQIWRSKATDEELKRRLTSDPHSPPRFRANGAAVNVDAFYEAFEVTEGDGMYLPPEERVKIW
jgi:endothelin-converting enzyme/putative endopeptidase